MAPRSKLTPVEEEFLGQVRQLLLDCPRAATLTAEQARELRRMVRSILKPAPSLTDIIGTVCTTGAACSWLGISRQALSKAVQAGRILGLRTADRKWVYPTWQFTAAGITSGLLEPTWDMLLSRFTRAGHEEPVVAAAAWFRVFHEGLGMTPAQWVLSSGELVPLLRAAKGAKAPVVGPLPRLADLPTAEVL